jgi:hypothetical protein
MITRIVFAIILVVVSVALGFSLAGGNPVDAVVNPSSDVAGGSFGTVKLTEQQLKVRVTDPNPDFDQIKINGPDGVSEGAIGVVSNGEYDWVRKGGYPSGNYTMKAIKNQMAGDDIVLEKHTVHLTAPG